MTENEILNKLIEQLKDEFNIEEDLNAETSLDGMLDSLDLINLMFFVESDLGVEVPDSMVEDGDVLVLGKLTKYIVENRS